MEAADPSPQIAQTSITYFYFIDTAMVKLNDVLSISLQYERMFVEVARVQNVLSDLYTEIYIFLEKIRKTVTKSCESIVAWTPVNLYGRLIVGGSVACLSCECPKIVRLRVWCQHIPYRAL